MRIVLASSLYPPHVVGGAERCVRDLAEGLVQRGHEVEVIAIALDGREMREQINGVGVRRIPVRNLYTPFGRARHSPAAKLAWHVVDSFNPAMLASLRVQLTEIAPDVIQTHNLPGLSAAIWHAAARLRIPVSHVLHDDYLLCPKTTMFRHGRVCDHPCLDCKLLSWPRSKAAKHVRAVVGVSRHILNRHARFFSGATYRHVIYNGCWLLRAGTPQRPRRPLVPLVLGYLGRLDPSKGIGWLLEAIDQDRFGSRIRLVVGGLGEASYEALLRQRSSLSSVAVEWRGHVEPARFLQDIDYLVVPSLWEETAARSIQEALASGVPVIGSQRGGTPELVGDAGFIYDPDNPRTFTEIIDRLLDDAAVHGELGERARIRAQAFDPRTMIDAHLSLLAQIIDDSERNRK